MVGRYQAYLEFHDTGVEWLGEIPKHWHVEKLKFFTSIQPSNVDKKTKEGELPVRLCNYTDVYYNDRIDESLEFMIASATEEQIEKFVLKAGDTIITKDSEDPADIAIPTYVPTDLPGVVCGYHLAMIRPNDLSYGPFIKRVFESGYARAYFCTRSNGLTRYGLGTYSLSNVFYPKPPREEAEQIANFLDHETAKIDTLIDKQQQLIKLLKEKRQAVISHAVTKGLNPEASMKDSGVEWLGEVPEGWCVKQLRHLASSIGGGTPSKDNPEYWNGDIPWISPKDMKTDYLDDAQDKITEQAIVNSSAKLIPEQSILLVVRGMILAHSVPVAMTLRPVTINQDMKAFIVDKRLLPEFLLFALQGAKSVIIDMTDQSAHGTKVLSTELLTRLSLGVPPIEEQKSILAELKKKLEVLDSTSEKAEDSVELLRERRTALISAAVTGKIDVRNWQPAG